MTITDKSKDLLIHLAQEWADKTNKTVDDIRIKACYASLLGGITREARAEALEHYRKELKAELSGAVRMAETIYDRDEVFNVLEQAIGIHMLSKTDLYDMSQN